MGEAEQWPIRNINTKSPILKQKAKHPLQRGVWQGQLVRNRAAHDHRTSKHKCETPSPPPSHLTEHPCISCIFTTMELTQTALQRLDQKRIDEVKRVRNTGESPLIEAAKCAKELGVN